MRPLARLGIAISVTAAISYRGPVQQPSPLSAAGADADAALIDALVPVAIAAGRAILAVRAAGFAVEAKDDRSPVTEADRRAEEIILEGLARLAPGLPVVAEEAVAAGHVPETGDAFVLVDALDGTKDFIGGGPDFTVNIGFVRGGVAVAGIVFAPALGRLWLGGAGGAFALAVDSPAARVPVRVRRPDPAALAIIASRSHRTPETDAFIARFPGSSLVAAGSSLKLTVLAEGGADLYPRLATTSQWDIAAGDAVLRAAGGRVLTMAGTPLPYGLPAGTRPEGARAWRNPWFVATGGLDPFALAH